MDTKRQRSELVLIDDRQELNKSDRDYFDVIVRWRPNQNQSDGSQSSWAVEMPSASSSSTINHKQSSQHQQRHHPPLSSWLCHVDCLVKSDEESTQQPTGVDNNTDSMNDVNEEEDEKDEVENPNIQDTIRSRSSQLLQVKRRMFPAAERCTEGHNASLYNNNSNHHQHNLTTARKEFTRARNACNPFEVLTAGSYHHHQQQHNDGGRGLGHLFMNRAAIKLANIDAILDFSLTTAFLDDDVGSPFVFVDLCGAPGGFSEYILWRCCTNQIPACRGYGMSLLGSNEYGGGTPWKLQEFSQFEHGTYLQYRICEGMDGTGDVFRWENVEALWEMMKADAGQQPRLRTTSLPSTEDTRVNDQVGKAHLVLADGGFDAQRDSEHQEEMAQKLIICEVAGGLALLRVGGTLVIKMFGFQTEVIRALVRDLDSMFYQLVALKPISSRPASAERYLVCMNFHGLPSSDWDGRKWSSRMFLGQHGQQPQQQQLNQRIERYLDQFDCDMLGLNLKTCFHILSFLESKCLAATNNGEESDFSSNTSDFLHGNIANESLVDIEAYKCSWQLV